MEHRCIRLTKSECVSQKISYVLSHNSVDTTIFGLEIGPDTVSHIGNKNLLSIIVDTTNSVSIFNYQYNYWSMFRNLLYMANQEVEKKVFAANFNKKEASRKIACKLIIMAAYSLRFAVSDFIYWNICLRNQLI